MRTPDNARTGVHCTFENQFYDNNLPLGAVANGQTNRIYGNPPHNTDDEAPYVNFGAVGASPSQFYEPPEYTSIAGTPPPTYESLNNLGDLPDFSSRDGTPGFSRYQVLYVQT